MKKQGIILLLSLWGLLGIPIGYLNEVIEDHHIRLLEWAQYPLGAAIFALIWGWFTPALALVKAFGVLDQVYQTEILVFPRNAVGWLLPILLWFTVFNILLLLGRRMKNSNKRLVATPNKLREP